jgi:hypothetical protein
MRNRMLLLYVSAGAGILTAATFSDAPLAQALISCATWPMSAGVTRMAAPVPTFGPRVAPIGPIRVSIGPIRADISLRNTDTILTELDTILGTGRIPKAATESAPVFRVA